MRKSFTSKGRKGASLLSYGLVVGLISVFALAAVTSTGSNVNSLFTQVETTLGDVASGSGAGAGASSQPSAEPSPTPQALTLAGFTTQGDNSGNVAANAVDSSSGTQWVSDVAGSTCVGRDYMEAEFADPVQLTGFTIEQSDGNSYTGQTGSVELQYHNGSGFTAVQSVSLPTDNNVNQISGFSTSAFSTRWRLVCDANPNNQRWGVKEISFTGIIENSGSGGSGGSSNGTCPSVEQFFFCSGSILAQNSVGLGAPGIAACSSFCTGVSNVSCSYWNDDSGDCQCTDGARFSSSGLNDHWAVNCN
ncbi:MAG: hypothetical protein Alpg2KO_06400 [Alphaproteobacteria bacterium]